VAPVGLVLRDPMLINSYAEEIEGVSSEAALNQRPCLMKDVVGCDERPFSPLGLFKSRECPRMEWIHLIPGT
jgi:hypothetical protein